MPEVTDIWSSNGKKPPAAALTDPLLNAARNIRPDVNTQILGKFDASNAANFHQSIGNPVGIAANRNIPFDAGKIVRDMPKYLEQTGVALAPVVHKLEKHAVKAGTLELIKKSGLIGGRALLAAKTGLSSSFDFSNGFKFSPAKFATSLAKSTGFETAGLSSVNKALTVAEIGAAFTGRTAQLHTIENGLIRTGVYAAAFAPTRMGNAELPFNPVPPEITKEQNEINAFYAHQEMEKQFKQNEYNKTQPLMKAFERASFEMWSEQEDKRNKENLENQKESNATKIFNKVSESGYRPDHVSAFFSKVV
jgi:hypothetical protein